MSPFFCRYGAIALWITTVFGIVEDIAHFFYSAPMPPNHSDPLISYAIACLLWVRYESLKKPA